MPTIEILCCVSFSDDVTFFDLLCPVRRYYEGHSPERGWGGDISEQTISLENYIG